MSSGSSSAGYVAAGLGWGIAVGVAAGMLVIAPAMGTLDFSTSPQVGETQQEEGASQEARFAFSDNVIAQHSTELVANALDGRSVLVLRTHDALADDVDAVAWLLRTAGASEAGQVVLGEKFTEQESADALSTIIANTLPAGAQLSVDRRAPGTHAGQSLGSVLLKDQATGEPVAPESDRNFVIEALRGGGFIEEAEISGPADAIVVIGAGDGGPERSFGTQLLTDMTNELDALASAVYAAPDENGGFVDTEAGKVSMVLKLAEDLAAK
ncbi:copper transporter [Corynebacterium sp. NML130628]|uniref:copper transporter n=1 Tax=Corynebacterium sp. NML130628 TaxID=1906333 RepID=UPI0008FB72CA|nr:copper transporter [Corynebacterium sp. NML130628]